jgi:HSP20 family protein
MSLVKRNSDWFFPRRVDQVFDRFLNDHFEDRSTSFNPRVDISETDQAFEIDLAVPGFDKKDFDIDLKEGLLSISGERKFDKEESGKNFYSVQTEYGTFKKSFQLPDSIIADQIEAGYQNGILSVKVPKDEAKKLASKISVK